MRPLWLQLRYLGKGDRFYAEVREVVETVGAQRVMRGTGAPYYRARLPDDAWLAAFTSAPEATFSAEEEAICGDTAARFFVLT